MSAAADRTLGERDRDVLTQIVKLHIATGEPVGSVAVSSRVRGGVSSATIRNIMGRLEEEGLVSQPHASAGRIPTDKGYRYYVDSILSTITRHEKLSKADELAIRDRLLGGELQSTEVLMERTSKLLSHLSENVGFVVSPSLIHDPIEHLQLIRLADRRILVIAVSGTGLVQDRVIRLDEEIGQDELDRTSRYLSENFRGMTLFQIRAELLALMSEEKSLYDRLLQNAIMLCEKGLGSEDDTGAVFVGGASNMLRRDDFPDTERLRALFTMFEEKSRLVKILNECLTPPASGSVNVVIGSENRVSTMRDCSLIASSYSYGEYGVGGIGLVGPMRMEYSRLISVVQYVAKLFEQILHDQSRARL